MKIIAIQESEKYLVQISEVELAYLLGRESSYKLKSDFSLKEGSVLHISTAWEQLRSLESTINFNERMVTEYKSQIARLEKMKMPKFERPKK